MMRKVLYTSLLLLCVEAMSAQNPLLDSLIAYYPFNGNANDSTGNGNDGTVSGALLTSDRFGNASSAYKFNGSSDYISLNAGPKFKPTTFPVSVCAWIKSNTADEDGIIFKNDYDPDYYTGILFQVQTYAGGVLEIHYGNGGTTGPCCRRSKFGTINVNDNQWHFVAGIIRGPTDMDLYVDCQYDPGYYSGDGDTLLYSSEPGSVGLIDVVGYTYHYKGSTDDIRFYHRELTLPDLQLLYYTPSPYGNPISTVSLGNDTALCPGSSLLLNPVVDGEVQSYLWSDGSTDSTLQVESSGEYWVQISDGCGVVSDTILVGKGFLDRVDLGPDTILCDGQFLILDAGSSYDTYLWSNGAFTQSIIVNQAGTYWVTVTGSGCTSTDSIQVSYTTCTGNNWQNGKPIQAIYDENNNCIRVSGTNCSDCSCRFVLYDVTGTLLTKQNFRLGQSQEIIYLPESLSAAFYLASFQIQDSFLNLPLVVTRR